MPGRSHCPIAHCLLFIVNCQLSIVHCQLKKRFALLTKCQMNRLRMPAVAPKYGLVTGKALLARFAKYRLTAFSQIPFPPARFFLFQRFLPSVFSHGRTQFHTSEIVPLRSLKNGDRWVFSYGRVGTTVRTRRYDGSRSSVRSQSQVLLTVWMGAEESFFALERV